MALLKDTTISGSLRATDTIYTNKIQTSIIGAPTSSNGTTFGVGTNGQVLKSNGTSVYWAAVSKGDVGLGNVENTALSTWAGTNKITTVGTITTGTWSGTAIAANKGGTGQTGYTIGDILYASGASALSKLGGNTTTTRKFLRSVATTSGTAVAPAWDTVTATDVGLSNVTNTAALNKNTGAKGDIIYWSAANTPAHLTNTSSTTKHFLSITSQAPSWSTVTKGDVGLGNVENTALSTWAGTNKIVTVGTITSGTWQGTTVAVNHGGTGATSFTANSVIMSGSTTTAALTTRAITDNSSNADVTSSDTNLITGRTLYYQLAKKGYLTSHQTIKQDSVTGATANRYATCAIAAGTAAKTASITSGTFTLETGATVRVKFTYSNTATNPTLNINSTGAKPIYKFGTTRPGATPEDSWDAGEVVTFVYDGAGWQMSSNPIMGLTTAQENALLALIT